VICRKPCCMLHVTEISILQMLIYDMKEENRHFTLATIMYMRHDGWKSIEEVFALLYFSHYSAAVNPCVNGFNNYLNFEKL